MSDGIKDMKLPLVHRENRSLKSEADSGEKSRERKRID